MHFDPAAESLSLHRGWRRVVGDLVHRRRRHERIALECRSRSNGEDPDLPPAASDRGPGEDVRRLAERPQLHLGRDLEDVGQWNPPRAPPVANRYLRGGRDDRDPCPLHGVDRARNGDRNEKPPGPSRTSHRRCRDTCQCELDPAGSLNPADRPQHEPSVLYPDSPHGLVGGENKRLVVLDHLNHIGTTMAEV